MKIEENSDLKKYRVIDGNEKVVDEVMLATQAEAKDWGFSHSYVKRPLRVQEQVGEHWETVATWYGGTKK